MISSKNNGADSCYTCVAGPTATLRSYLQLSFGSSNDPYTVDIYPDRLYTIKFYDVSAQCIRNVSGRVIGVSQDTIALVQVSLLSNSGNICLNLNKDKLAGYIGSKIYSIPVNNISSIVPVLDEDTEIPDHDNEDKVRRERTVAVLGLSSSVVHAIMVDITIYDDQVDTAVDTIHMEVGGTYHVTYAAKDGSNSLYEIEGQLINISECEEFGSEPDMNGYVRPCPHNMEEIGWQGNAYEKKQFYALPKENPDANRIKFTFDTSRPLHKSFDSCTLGQIRNVQRLEEGRPPIDDKPGCGWPDHKPDECPPPPPVEMPHPPFEGCYPPPPPPPRPPYGCPPPPPPPRPPYGCPPPPPPPRPPYGCPPPHPMETFPMDHGCRPYPPEHIHIHWEHPDHPGCEYNKD